MRLSAKQLRAFTRILEGLDNGGPPPRLPGPLGLYFRQYASGRTALRSRLKEMGWTVTRAGWIAGQASDRIHFHAIGRARVVVGGRPIGEATQLLGVSEELACVTQAVFWHKTPQGNKAARATDDSPHLEFVGRYRWTPPSRFTPGSAEVSPTKPATWATSACLASTADDFGRPPHALEYVLDFEFGEPGLKSFRSICGVPRKGGWLVLPGFSTGRIFDIVFDPPADPESKQLYQLLVYREPWAATWHVVESRLIDDEGAFAHSLAWAQFRAALLEDRLSAPQVATMSDSLRAAGIRSNGDLSVPAPVTSKLGSAVVRWLRGIDRPGPRVENPA